MSRRRVAVMGATGSIGTQTFDVLRLEPDRFEVVAVSAGSSISALAAIVNEFDVPRVGVPTILERDALMALVTKPIAIFVGAEAVPDLLETADIVVNAVVGFAGLPVTLATLGAGKQLALANKESLIAAAPLVEQVRQNGGVLLPVDSEHCAIHQCLAGAPTVEGRSLRRLLLTASGGPFRTFSSEQLAAVTRADALRHPTWAMGPKITIDSSTLMNKGLEVLEAAALFNVSVDDIEVVVHPQSIVHSMVEFVDGSVLAQLSTPDMRLPIAYCLGFPERLDHGWGRLDFTQSHTLEFFAPDRERFPALDLAYAAARRGGAAPAWLSAANEVAVAAFLDDRIAWRDIVPLVATTLDSYQECDFSSIEELVLQDATARRVAHDTLPA